MAKINQTPPPLIWPDIEDDAPCNLLPLDYALKIEQDIKAYSEKCQLFWIDVWIPSMESCELM